MGKKKKNEENLGEVLQKSQEKGKWDGSAKREGSIKVKESLGGNIGEKRLKLSSGRKNPGV